MSDNSKSGTSVSGVNARHDWS
ncbi:MAG: hypothetical protein K0R68_876, partial [Mycobacterium sp.]|nr:hypothetical protein [Mycobacterium sp.]